MTSKGLTRRELLAVAGLGGSSLALGGTRTQDASHSPFVLHHAPRARRIVFLFQSGGPSHLDLFDPKPELVRRNGEELPASVRMGQRLTGMSGNQSSLPLAASPFEFAQHGQSGAWVSSLLPHTARVADDLTFLKGMHTSAINHDPAVTFVQTGSELSGRPSLPAWISYGLGSSNPDLPASCILLTKNKGGQPLYARLWGSGFLPSRHQGVQFRSSGDPVLFLGNPPGVDRAVRRRMLDTLGQLHRLQSEREGDPEIASRMAQHELAFAMQASVPEATDLSSEPEEVFELYGQEARDPGTYAANCLLARRLLERDVRCVQLFHQGWDQHGNLPGAIRTQCKETDQASAALVTDLKRRGLLEDTLVIWGGEFGRTSYSQGKLTSNNFGRDHHPRCFTMWMAGGGMRPGFSFGETDDLGYNLAQDGVHVHDFQALVLHLMGIDHERLVYPYQGRDFRLTDVHGKVPWAVMA
ncbi:MAG: DUF1501 domain-containing protein [Planctomycetota bacterium]|jgi:hypothetical protein|nr:DUF1501 domain-containing protein [Planctomycetota bacterium]MDP6937850.1 DUF1501 domain-containing protein [Planctomycetota bacterium]